MIKHNDKVHFEAIDPENLETMRRWRNDETIYKWCRQYNLIDEVSQMEWFEATRGDPSVKLFGIHESKNNDLVGVGGLTKIDMVSRTAEFSIYIATEHQNKKLSKPALSTIFHYGFDWLGLNLIWGETFSDNPGQIIFTSVGMTYEATLRSRVFRTGKFLDSKIYSITGEEWKALKS